MITIWISLQLNVPENYWNKSQKYVDKIRLVEQCSWSSLLSPCLGRAKLQHPCHRQKDKAGMIVWGEVNIFRCLVCFCFVFILLFLSFMNLTTFWGCINPSGRYRYQNWPSFAPLAEIVFVNLSEKSYWICKEQAASFRLTLTLGLADV